MFLHNTIHTNEMETELPATGRLFPVSSIIIMEKNEHEFNAEKRDDHKIPSKQQKLYLSTIVVCIIIQNPFLFTTRRRKIGYAWFGFIWLLLGHFEWKHCILYPGRTQFYIMNLYLNRTPDNGLWKVTCKKIHNDIWKLCSVLANTLEKWSDGIKSI